MVAEWWLWVPSGAVRGSGGTSAAVGSAWRRHARQSPRQERRHWCRRHGAVLPACFLPLREVSARELGLVCSHWRLPLARQPAAAAEAGLAEGRAAKKSINALAAAFIAGMEAHNPGRQTQGETTVMVMRGKVNPYKLLWMSCALCMGSRLPRND